ncbi:Spore protein SP21 [Bordetella ansorpii]|jgi:HSP20 family protein|uniref:Spore protein SP21 n=1 Tax=Bordetella ansorpii TaxID=288768 RepID=A0A157KBI4_9BORD|nr:Hsp20/alpha crystallin family protein [Bordetella ansorpii]SAH81720.1 Spore protein SP21 [Bordetella ansorpii]
MTTESPVAVRGGNRTEARVTTFVPPVDIIEDAKGITLIADLPGVSKEQLQIHVQAERLVIEAEARIDVPADVQAFHTEVEQPRYRRAFNLSAELDTAAIEATLKDGVLTLRIPRSQAAQPRRVEVQLG